MAQVVGSHGVAVFTSPNNGDTLDATVVKGNDNNMRSAYVDHDSDAGLHVQSSPIVSRPAAGSIGRKWLTADTSSYRLFFDDGSSWYELSYLSSNGGTITGNLDVTGTITGAVTGNASTATALQTARNINGEAFDGTANITVTAAAGTLTGTTLASGVTASSLTSVGTLGTLAVSGNATFDTSTLFVDATNNRVGVGTVSPIAPLHVVGNGKFGTGVAANSQTLMVNTPSGTAAGLQLFQDANESWVMSNPASSTALAFSNSGTERMRLDASGNLGLGVTPSAWSSIQGGALQTSGAGAIWSTGVTDVFLSQNAFFNGSYRYVSTNAASAYRQLSGAHQWFNAASGTAGNAITFTQAMTLDASGNLGVGTTSPTRRLSVIGAAVPTYINIGSGNNTSLVGLLLGGTTNPSNGQVLYDNSNNSMQLFTSGIERARIDSSGNLAVTNAVDVGSLTVQTTAAVSRKDYGYGVPYKAITVGGTTTASNVALCVDVSAIAGSAFSGSNQVFVPANGLLTPNAAGTNFIGVLSRDASNRIIIGPSITSGISSGPLFIDNNNLGLGVTPSAWGVFKAFQFGTVGSMSSGSGITTLGHNLYFDGTNFRYLTATNASFHEQTAGQHKWYTAPSGTAGAAISFTQTMTLDASGQLAIGTTSSVWGVGKAIEINNAGNAIWSPQACDIRLLTNARYDGGSYRYTSSGNPAAAYFVNGSATGGHVWYNAPSGTAGNVITFTPVMTVDQSGNLALGSGYMRVAGASAGAASTTTIGNTTATTVGATGAASALPANPLGYIIAHVGTTQVKIPYYTA